jgi:soluble lytic murein transglycosylase-like protein
MGFLPRPTGHRQWKNWTTVRLDGERAWVALVVMLWICAVIDMHATLARRSASEAPMVVTPSTGVVTAGTNAIDTADEVTATPGSNSGRRVARVADGARRHPTPARTGRARLRAYTEEEIQDLIRVYAEAFGIDPALPLAIARCESQFQWDAANRSSSARGVFQYVAGTWATTQEGRRGTSAFDADANIRMALTHMTTIGTSPWNASRSCWD